VRNEFRQVERLTGMKCFPGGEIGFRVSVRVVPVSSGRII